MKKILLTLAMVLLVAVNVYAQDADGVWMAPIPGENNVILAMTRESDTDILILTFLNDWDGSMNAWFPFGGAIDNNTGVLSLILTSQENGNIPSSATGLFSMTSLTTATFRITSCTDYVGQSNCVPVGTIFNFTRLF